MQDWQDAERRRQELEKTTDPGWEARYREHVNSAAAAEPHKSGLNRKQRRALERELRSVEKKLRKLKELLPGV